MGAGHGHGHASASGRHRWRLRLAFGLVAGFFGVELGFGLWSGSLALLSDAGHMAADVVALGAALVATLIATRKDTTGTRTFGSYRAEVFASGLTVLIMLGVSAYVVAEAIGRPALGSECGIWHHRFPIGVGAQARRSACPLGIARSSRAHDQTGEIVAITCLIVSGRLSGDIRVV